MVSLAGWFPGRGGPHRNPNELVVKTIDSSAPLEPGKREVPVTIFKQHPPLSEIFDGVRALFDMSCKQYFLQQPLNLSCEVTFKVYGLADSSDVLRAEIAQGFRKLVSDAGCERVKVAVIFDVTREVCVAMN